MAFASRSFLAVDAFLPLQPVRVTATRAAVVSAVVCRFIMCWVSCLLDGERALHPDGVVSRKGADIGVRAGLAGGGETDGVALARSKKLGMSEDFVLHFRPDEVGAHAGL